MADGRPATERLNRTARRERLSRRFGAQAAPNPSIRRNPPVLWRRERLRKKLYWSRKAEKRGGVHWIVNDTALDFYKLVLVLAGLAAILMLWYGLNNDGGLR